MWRIAVPCGRAFSLPLLPSLSHGVKSKDCAVSHKQSDFSECCMENAPGLQASVLTVVTWVLLTSRKSSDPPLESSRVGKEARVLWILP